MLGLSKYPIDFPHYAGHSTIIGATNLQRGFYTFPHTFLTRPIYGLHIPFYAVLQPTARLLVIYRILPLPVAQFLFALHIVFEFLLIVH
jgi:hypothetical protein